MGEPHCRFQHESVHKGLWKVAAQLALGDVVFLGEQSGRPAGRTVTLKPRAGGKRFALLVIGQSRDEAA
jgi:hypothetical protein